MRRPRRPPLARALRPEVPAGLGRDDQSDDGPRPRALPHRRGRDARLPYLPAAGTRYTAHAASTCIRTRRARHGHRGRAYEPQSTADLAPGRVLIVDDQPDIRRLCRVSLAAEGLACDEAGAGPDVRDRPAKAPYDLVSARRRPAGYSGEEVSAGSGSGRRRTSRSSCFRRGQRRRVVADHARRRG